MGRETSNFTYRGTWMTLIRPATLSGTITPALAGTAWAWQRGTVRWDLFILFLAAALMVQISANIWNDYFDFLKGQDSAKWMEGVATRYHPRLAELPAAAGILIMIAAIIGIRLALHAGIFVVWAGAISVLAALFYSAGRKPLSALGLGETVAAVFLGFVVALLAYGIQDVPPDGSVLIVSLPFAFLIAGMILTNNIRDIEKDRPFRCTLPIRIGRPWAIRLLVVLTLSAYVVTALFVLAGILPPSVLVVAAALPFSRHLHRLLSRNTAEDDIAAMPAAARQHWAFGVLYSAGLFFALI